MKTFLNTLRYATLVCAFSITGYFSFAQSVGIGTNTPNANSILDVTVPNPAVTPQGMLLPRLDAVQRGTLGGALGLADEGMIVYDTFDSTIYHWTGTIWQAVGSGSGTAPFGITGNVVSLENGTYATDDFVFGSPQLDDDTDFNHFNRFFFDKSLGAFRAGSVSGNNWNVDSLGMYSFAAGQETKALSTGDAAFGTMSVADGGSSFAAGDMSIADGFNSVAMGRMSEAHVGPSAAIGHFAFANSSESYAYGFLVTANGMGSTAIGQNSTADGDQSLVFGNNLTAPSYGETALGIMNTTYVPNNANGFDPLDRLLTVGNGNLTNSDAMVMLKNGNTVFGGTTPLGPFHVSVDLDATPDSLFMVDTAGNVGVGTVPTGTYKIEIAGNIGTLGINELSDARWKKNIISVDNALNKVMKLEGVYYDWRKNKYPEKGFSDRRQIGFIAQEVEKVLPEVVGTDVNGYKSVEYSKLTALLTQAIKEQQKIIQSQSTEINQLKAEMEAVKRHLGMDFEAKK